MFSLLHGLLAVSTLQLTPVFAVLAVILVFSVLVALLLVKAKQSLLVGYFICGVVLANSGILDHILANKDSTHVIHLLADLGVILLMFTLGIEFPLKDIKRIWRITFLGGALQVALTAGILLSGGLLMGLPFTPTFIIAVALALSSTAVSLKSFQDLGLSNQEPDSPSALHFFRIFLSSSSFSFSPQSSTSRIKKSFLPSRSP